MARAPRVDLIRNDACSVLGMESVPSVLPVLPIRNAVLFPSISMPLVVGRERSIRAVERSEASGSLVVVITQRLLTPGDPKPDDLYRIGALCKIENVTRTETGSQQVVVTGIARFRVAELELTEGNYLATRGETVNDVLGEDAVRRDALFYNLKEISREILELLPGTTDPLIRLIERVDDPSYLTNVCAAYLNLPLPKKQELLEHVEVESRMDLLLAYMRKEREVLTLQREIRDKMSERLNKAQRDALLREQMRTIRTELGEEADEHEADELEQKLLEADLPPEARKQCDEELKRLRSLPSSSAEFHVVRTYLEWLAALPWNRLDRSVVDLSHARRILDEDHSGLEAVKKRIVQFLAVSKLRDEATRAASAALSSPSPSPSPLSVPLPASRPDEPALRGAILCLVGPPGVGKTSLGKSIARALGRKFARASLGGVRDEAEIRGHRRTYVGALPGRVIQTLKRAGTRNPVLVLDEIDKIRADFQGDPASAMLEVLDPEQNQSFTDHYLDVPFDLSEVFFVATANVLDSIPAPLRDRMEIIEVNGYTSFEKLEIARSHLLPKLLREHGISPDWVELPDETLRAVISRYTREAGVRELQRRLAGLLRSAAEEVLELRSRGARERVLLTPSRLRALLGPERHTPETLDLDRKPGVATGLAWTPHGGDILQIEVAALRQGRGGLLMTGQLGDVMKESAHIALSLARSATSRYFKRTVDFASVDLHIHVPAGAIPKDGPSAGVTILAALASLIADRPIRPGIAMTGEITLRGTVLPVGGIKEKVLAAHRAGVRTIIFPARNEGDLDEVPAPVRAGMRFLPVDTVEQVLNATLDMGLLKRDSAGARERGPEPEARSGGGAAA
jgi:ATP-dependent Lon protease